MKTATSRHAAITTHLKPASASKEPRMCAYSRNASLLNIPLSNLPGNLLGEHAAACAALCSTFNPGTDGTDGVWHGAPDHLGDYVWVHVAAEPAADPPVQPTKEHPL